MTVEEIVADAESAHRDGAWPVHPADGAVTPDEARTLYLGAAGMLWALRRLGSTLEVELEPLDQPTPSLLVGESGILLVTRADDERLQALVDANERNAAWELLWGSAGTILAAKHAGLEWRRSAEILADEWGRSGGLWTQTIGGKQAQYLGAAHGFAANVHALRGLVDDDVLRRRIEPVLREHAVWHGDAVNWPPIPGMDADRVQWCHGAPGIVATLGDLLPEDLLLAAAETTWRTGPLAKGQGLCHGTAGNGFALLKTWSVTGDGRWLDRARVFADAALAQCDGRYSLFTGDVGAALLARACDARDPRFPILDVA
ncbi:MAG TPA: LanC-like protein [Gaiellaceae bacterium]|nr:LanC-like protein [Gaiellaceae bacterium]